MSKQTFPLESFYEVELFFLVWSAAYRYMDVAMTPSEWYQVTVKHLGLLGSDEPFTPNMLDLEEAAEKSEVFNNAGRRQSKTYLILITTFSLPPTFSDRIDWNRRTLQLSWFKDLKNKTAALWQLLLKAPSSSEKSPGGRRDFASPFSSLKRSATLVSRLPTSEITTRRGKRKCLGWIALLYTATTKVKRSLSYWGASPVRCLIASLQKDGGSCKQKSPGCLYLLPSTCKLPLQVMRVFN